MTKSRKQRARMRQAQSRAKKSRSISVAPPMPLGGDHGTGTAAAMYDTELAALVDENGKNPNHIGRRQRRDHLKEMLARELLTMRQWQAAQAIRNAFCKTETLSSGSPLKERVQSSPKPDATVAVQVDAMSRLVFVMEAVRNADRALIEAVCWYNMPLRAVDARRGGHRLRESLDMVADHIGY